MPRPDPSITPLEDALRRRILVMDGAMGTMIQGMGLREADFRGTAFTGNPGHLLGNNDLLSVTRPDLIDEIHRGFLAAGSDLIETNTFNANRISQAEYGLAEHAPEINREAARPERPPPHAL